MRNTLILLFLAAFQLFADDSYSQNTKLTLNLKDATVENVLDEIEDQSEFYFLFNYKLVDVERQVDILAEDESISTILASLFKETKVNYFVVDRQIILSPQEFKVEEIISKQGTIIRGQVLDENGEPLPGAAIMIKGTTRATLTNPEGEYTIEVDDPSTAVLIFSFIGYLTQEIAVGNQTTLNVTMALEMMQLADIVVVGYGTQRKSDLTGTISSVSADKLRESAAVSLAETLAGKVTGVQVQEINGAPGGGDIMIRVRGTSSITASNDPLYVIDGYPMEEGGLNMLNPYDIQSIEILKDASASAIYGSRGGNGVVIITTKSGESGKKVNIEFNLSSGIQQVSHRPEMMNSYEYAEWFIDGHNNAWIQADPVNNKITDPNDVRQSSYYIIPDEMYTPEVLPNTNWGDLIFRNAWTQNYQLNISKNDENGHALIGASYVKQDGIVIETGYEKFNIHSNFLSRISERFSVGGNIDVSYATSDLIEEGKYGPVELSIVVAPVYPAYNPDGTYGSPVSSTWFKGDDPSPLEGAYEFDWTEKRYRGMARLFAELEIIPGLKYNLSVGGVKTGRQEDRYRPSYVGRDSNPPPNLADARQNSTSGINWLVENMLNYQTTFGANHSLNALVGYTAQKNRSESLYIYATNFPNDQVHTLNAGQVTDGNTTISEHALLSYIARINYNFADKYLLTASIRTDGSSRFGENNKWGTFPSASVGWRLSEENFMQNVRFINNQKIRVSYGFTGNYSIPNYGSIGLLDTDYYVLGTGSGSLVSTIYPSTISNPDLGWEKTQQFNIGMDVGMFSNRIYFEVDYYNSITKDLLLNVPVPRITGFGSALQNIGKVRNQGLEFLLTTRNIVRPFNWTTDFNISLNRNEVLALGPDNKPIYASAPNASNSFITEIGSPMSNIFGYIFDGVYLTQEQINAHAHLPTDVPGDPIIRDVNGDGEITSADRAVIGNNNPDFIFGLSNSFTYKNFDLTILLNGSYGAEMLRLSSRFTDFYHGDRNGSKENVNRWRSPEQPGDGEYFRANRLFNGRQKEPSTYWLEDASFLRIKNVILGYNFGNNLLSSTPIASARIFFTCTNLYTFTNYWGFDPEASTTGTGLAKGGDYSAYPLARTFLLGVNINF